MTFSLKYPYARKPSRGLRPNLSHPTLRDCIVWWPFTEGTGTTVRNVIRPGYFDGAPGSSTDFEWVVSNGLVAAKTGTASTDYILGSESTDLNATEDAFTILTYCKIIDTGPNGARLFILADTYQTGDLSGKLFGYHSVYDGTWRTGSDTISNNDIVKHAYSVSAGTGTVSKDVYLNRQSNNSWSGNKRNIDKIGLSWGGTNASSDFITAEFYDFRIYARKLELGEVNWINNNLWAPFERRVWIPVIVDVSPSGTGTITLGESIVSAQGLMEPSGTGVLVLDEAVLAASALQEFLSTGILALDDTVLDASGVQGNVSTGTVALSEVLVDASGAQEYIATAAPILSETVLDATGLAAVAPVGTGTLVLDSTVLDGTGVQAVPSTGEILLDTTVLDASGSALVPEGTGTIVLDQSALDAQATMLPDGSAVIVLDLVVLNAQGLGPAPEGSPWIIHARRRGRR